MHLLFTALFVGCMSTPDAPGPEAAEPTTTKEAPAPEAEAPKTDAIHVEPVSIQFDAASKRLAVEAHLTGAGVAMREAPVHVGVTVVTESGTEVDLIVHTLFPGAMEESVLFSTALDETPQQVLIGAWNDRIEPCQSERPGCKEFGFVLDASIASFPAGLYTDGVRQRLIPEDFSITVYGDAGDIASTAQQYAKPFGAEPKVSVVTLGPDAADVIHPRGVSVRRADDRGIARAIAAPLDLQVFVSETDLPADVVVVR